MKVNAKVGLQGVFTGIEVLDRNGGLKRAHPGFVNLITDAGLAMMSRDNQSSQGNLFGYLKVSTDNSPPQFSDTVLQQMLAAQSSPTSASGVEVEEGYAWRRFTWTFPLGAVVGNIAKLATGWQASNNTNFSIALIKDENGNPTTITILEDEQLRVSWEHRRYWSPDDVTGTLANSGNKGGSYDYVLRANRVSEWAVGDTNGGRVNVFGVPASGSNMATAALRDCALYAGEVTMGSIFERPSGGEGIPGAGTRVGGSELASGVSARWRMPIGSGNHPDGVSFMVFGTGSTSSGDMSAMGFKVAFDPPILKTNQDILDIEVQINWSRV